MEKLSVLHIERNVLLMDKAFPFHNGTDNLV